MRFRRRGRVPFRRRKQRTAWLTGAQSACPEPIRIVNCDEFDQDPTAFPDDSFNLVVVPPSNTPGVVEGGADTTVLRVVGDLHLHSMMFPNNGPIIQCGLVMWHVGVLFADVDPNTGLGLAPMQSAATSYDAETKDWLWRWHDTASHMAVLGTDGADCCHTEHKTCKAHIDFTVKRKLRRDEALFLQVIALWNQEFTNGSGLGSGSFQTSLTANVRVLVSLP